MTEAVPPISDELLAEIERGLEGVTPGPWSARVVDRPQWVVLGPGKHFDAIAVTSQGNDEPNATHIANCDPDTIRSLIARLRASEAVKAEVVGTDGSAKLGTLPRIISDLRHETDAHKYGSIRIDLDEVRTILAALHPQRTP